MSQHKEKPAVYVTHQAIDSGSEFRLDEVVGVLELELNPEIERISESTEDLEDLWLDNLPDEFWLGAMTTDAHECARIMNKIRRAKSAMTLRVVWTNGVAFEVACLVESVFPPSGCAGLYRTTVGLRRRRRPRIGFRRDKA